MKEIIGRLGSLYSADVAVIAKKIVTSIENGDYKTARKSILALSGDGSKLVRHHMLSLLEFKQGRFSEAEAALNFGINQNPDVYIVEYCQTMLEFNRQDVALGILGGLQRNEERHGVILDAIDSLIERNPHQGLLPFRNIAINILVSAGCHGEALTASVELPDSRLNNIASVLSGLTQAQRMGSQQTVTITAKLERDLVRIIEDSVLNLQLIRKQLADFLDSKFLKWKQQSASLAAISLDPLLRTSLMHTELFNEKSEIHLTCLRQQLLQQTIESNGGPVPYLDLILAMIVQCEKNQ